MKEEVRKVVEELITFRTAVRVIEQPSGFAEIAGYLFFRNIRCTVLGLECNGDT